VYRLGATSSRDSVSLRPSLFLGAGLAKWGRQIVKARPRRKVVVEMTVDEQGAAAMAIWCEAMVQLGEDLDRLIGDRVAQDGGPDNES
jgi:hypothetical protein